MTGEQRVPHGYRRKPFRRKIVQRVHVTQTFAHLFAVNEQVLTVIPVIRKGYAVAAFALSDFIFVVGKEKVYSAGMEIDRVAKNLFAHGAALNVPPGTTAAPRTIP